MKYKFFIILTLLFQQPYPIYINAKDNLQKDNIDQIISILDIIQKFGIKKIIFANLLFFILDNIHTFSKNCNSKVSGNTSLGILAAWAIRNDHITILNFLIKICKVNPNFRNISALNLLEIAALNNKPEAAQILVDNGANVLWAMQSVHEDDKAFNFYEKHLFFAGYSTYKGHSAAHSPSNHDFIFFGTKPIISIMQKTPILNRLTRLTQASDHIISPAFFMLPYFMASLCGRFELARSAGCTKYDDIFFSLFFDPLSSTNSKHENTLYDFFKNNELLTTEDITKMNNSKKKFDFNDDLRKKIQEDLAKSNMKRTT